MSFKDSTLLFLAEYPGSFVVRSLGATLRLRRFGKCYYEERLRGGSKRVVYAFWHCHIIPLTIAYAHQEACVLVSEHRDGEVIARVVHRLGFKTERGSTTRGGIKALKALVRFKENPRGGDIAITPDGPRGPARKAQKGAIFIALKTGFPIVPVGVAIDKPWVLNTWDGFQIPKPFSRCAVVAGDEIDPVGETGAGVSMSEESIEENARLLEERLGEAERSAYDKLRLWNK